MSFREVSTIICNPSPANRYPTYLRPFGAGSEPTLRLGIESHVSANFQKRNTYVSHLNARHTGTDYSKFGLWSMPMEDRKSWEAKAQPIQSNPNS